jgi:transposase
MEPYQKTQLKANDQRTKKAGIRQVQRRLVALDLSQEELINLFSIHSLSGT